MKKTLGQIAHEAYYAVPSWDIEGDFAQASWQFCAQAVKRAVLRELRRQGRLAPPPLKPPKF